MGHRRVYDVHMRGLYGEWAMNKRTKKRKAFNAGFMKARRKKLKFTYQRLADKVGSSKSYMYELCCLKDLEPSGTMVLRLQKH